MQTAQIHSVSAAPHDGVSDGGLCVVLADDDETKFHSGGTEPECPVIRQAFATWLSLFTVGSERVVSVPSAIFHQRSLRFLLV